MVWKNKYNLQIINDMKNTMNPNGMSFDELKAAYDEMVAKSYEYLKAMVAKREEEMKEAVRAYKEAMRRLGFSEEQMKASIDSDAAMISSIAGQMDIPVAPAALDNPQNNADEILALPEPTWEKGDVTLVDDPISINPETEEEENCVEKEVISVWEHPALTAPYNPVVAKENVSTPEPEVTPVEKSDVELTSMEELLSDDLEYMEYFAPKHLEKNDRTIITLDELLSDEPINRIPCMGNLLPKGAPFRQHTRICHANGIIPTETATGQTLIYTPPAPSVAA